MSKAVVLVLSTLLFSSATRAQILIEDPSRPKTGERAARRYFAERSGSSDSRGPSSDFSSGLRHLNIYLGNSINDKQYRWGAEPNGEDVGSWMFGVSYRLGEWVNSMDLFLRSEILSYDIDGEKPVKWHIGTAISFPDAKSSFPAYFGAGVGAGIFFNQVASESDLSFDYRVMAGLRSADLLGDFGLSLETSLHGHVHLLSSGQFKGVYLALGTVFEF